MLFRSTPNIDVSMDKPHPRFLASFCEKKCGLYMDVYGNYSMSTQYIMKIMEIEICLILVPLHTDSFAIVSS